MPPPLHATTSTPQPQPFLEPKSSITQLPTELLDMIFSALIEPPSSNTDTNVYLKDVRGCALICRRLGAVCRKYIFRDISVKAADKARILAFGELVKSRESIKEDVRILRYDADPDTPPRSREPPLTLILDLLSHQRIHTFHITGNDFNQLHPPLVDAVTAFIISNPLVSLGLHNVFDMPARYLSSQADADSVKSGWLQPTVKSLTLDHVDVGGSVMSPLAGSAARAQLERFEVRKCYLEMLVGHLVPLGYRVARDGHTVTRSDTDKREDAALSERLGWSPIDFTQLKYFRISDDDVRDETIKSDAAVELIGYVLETTQCLEYLCLEEANAYEALYNTSRVLSTSISPSSFRSLKCLEIILNHKTEPPDDPYFFFTDELANLERLSETKLNGTPLGLEVLKIQIIADQEELLSLDPAEWSKLDTVLMDDITASGTCNPRAAFRNLREVEVIVDWGYCESESGLDQDQDQEERRPSLAWIGQHAFPRLRASGTVGFTFVISSEAGEETSDSESDGDCDCGECNYDSETS